MAGETEDLHLPHYIDLFGGIVFLESTKKYEERLRKALGRESQRRDDRGPAHDPPRRDGRRGGAGDRSAQAQPAAGGRARPSDRRRHADRRARRAHSELVLAAGRGTGRHGRDRAQLRSAVSARAAVRGGEGERLRPWRRRGRARRLSAAARRGSRWRPRARPRSCAPPGSKARCWSWARSSPEELRGRARRADADVVAWREDFVAGLPRRRARPRQARHRDGPARHARSRGGRAGRGRRGRRGWRAR